MTTDKQARKETPMARGFIDYFPLAIAAAARVSFVGSKQHNHGEEMRWDRTKSLDHADCLIRHFTERGTLDTDGQSHSAKVLWRAAAICQLEEEAKLKTEQKLSAAQIEEGRRTVEIDGKIYAPPECWADGIINKDSPEYEKCINEILGNPVTIDTTPPVTTDGQEPCISYTSSFSDLVDNSDPHRPAPLDIVDDRVKTYIAGPMRGYKDYNFPAFDAARDRLLKLDVVVISPADMDRTLGHGTNRDYAKRDTKAILECDAIYMLKGWEKSVGATAEHALAKWAGLTIFYQEER